jgi:hypothetical protein
MQSLKLAGRFREYNYAGSAHTIKRSGALDTKKALRQADAANILGVLNV